MTEKVKEWSILSAASDVIRDAEKIIENPVIREVPEVKQLNLTEKKRRYERWNDFDFTGTFPELKNIEKSISGTFAIDNGRISLSTKLPVPAATYAFDGSVGLDKTLKGKLIVTTNSLVNEKIKSKSPYASLLFNEQGALVLPVSLGGEVTSPNVSLNLTNLQSTFDANARAMVEREVKQQLESAVNKSLAGKKSAIEKRIENLPEDKKNQAKGILQDLLKKKL